MTSLVTLDLTDLAPEPAIRRRSGRVRDSSITLAHGGGGKAMRDLIDDVFVSGFDNPLFTPNQHMLR